MIERVRLRNFRRYKEATLPFQPGVNFIEGRNNVGKTSLFYAIEYAFFGRVENFKTIRSLVQPGKRSMGVELVFAGKSGERYLLQRVHQMPPRSRKTMEGHFTLKQLAQDGERYLLASDFGDTEDKLALKLRELTGLNRRLFSVALHMRQGDIAAILDGAKQLDIVLGVTAAAMAEEELRQMALELEKECAGLGVLEERSRAIGGELSGVVGELATLESERKTTQAKLAALGEDADPRVELDRRLAPLLAALATHEEKHDLSERARHRLEDEQERRAEAVGSGSLEEATRELAKLEADGETRARLVAKLEAELDDVDTKRRRVDQQRGDLSGRIERRRGLPTGADATCEACGAPIEAAHVAEELAKWMGELEQIDKVLSEFDTRQTTLQTAVDHEQGEERKQLERVARLQEQREKLTQLDASRARRQRERDEATAAQKTAFASVQAEAKSLAPSMADSSIKVAWQLDGEPDSVVASIQETIQTIRQTLAERAGQQIAQRQALAELLERFDNQKESLEDRQSNLEREQATVLAEVNTQRIKESRAARFRRLSAGFKEFQVQVRSEAATRLAADSLSLHRQLSERDEFEALSIDPAQYAVQVVPRDLGEEVPAALYEGGGHRLLLGLAFRLAVARLVEYCPFLLLDEPTYGLDVAHREALLNRIAKQDVSRQILLVTHQAMGDVSGHRIQVVRQGRETVVADSPPAS